VPGIAAISSELTVLVTGFGAFPLQYVIRACWLPSKRELTCPMHGPHAFASTKAPTFSSAEVNPSRSIVARICSEPGVHRNGTYHTVKTLLSVPTCLHHRYTSLVIGGAETCLCLQASCFRLFSEVCCTSLDKARDYV